MTEIYLDNAATTRTDEIVADLVCKMMTEFYGNPSSLHSKGLEAQRKLDTARKQVADALGAVPDEVYFTSGGTEANNIALLGTARALRRRGDHIVATEIEHASIMSALKHLESEGFTVDFVSPGRDGNIDPDKFAEAVTEKTILCTCMLVNSETGSLLHLDRISRLVKRKNSAAVMHSDAVQAFGKLPFTVKSLGVDLLTVSAHKIYAPKGVGALYVKKGTRVLPVVYGGSQEKSLRPGTESVPLCCAFGQAAENAFKELYDNLFHTRVIHEYFVNNASFISGICMNSDANSTPYIVNISIPGYRSETMLHYLADKGIYVSSGSACSKGAKSKVLTSMGLKDSSVDSALRISFSKHTKKTEIDAVLECLKQGMSEIAVSKK